MTVSNTDDHFRNHGFILTKDGWILSPVFDVNPNNAGEYLSLNVDLYDSRIDFDLAIETAPYFDLSKKQAKESIDRIKELVGNNWKQVAKKYGISRNEINRMSPAFRLSEL
jgi:serine/threonine-protein kinase HipA